MSNPFFSQFTCLIYKEFFGNHYTFGSSTDLSKKKITEDDKVVQQIQKRWSLFVLIIFCTAVLRGSQWGLVINRAKTLDVRCKNGKFLTIGRKKILTVKKC